MNDILIRVLQACKLAQDLESSLPHIANNPYAVLASCEEVAEAFNKAVRDIKDSWSSSSFDPGHLLLNQQQLMEQGGDHFFVQDPMPGSELGFSQLGFDIHEATSSMAAVAEFISSASKSSFSGAAHEHAGAAVGEAVLPEIEVPVGSMGQRASRRRRESGEARTVRIPALRTGNLDLPPDDGYTWRKYGQKAILGCKFPRSYYRCTHKNFYGCKAKRKVQRLDSDPNTYEITYCGQHTCQTSPTPLFLPSLPPASSENVMGNPAGGGEARMIGALQQPEAVLSTSIELGVWFCTETSSRPREFPHPFLSSQAGESSCPSETRQPAGTGRERDGSVADLADVMFNSGSSSSSMDAFFHP